MTESARRFKEIEKKRESLRQFLIFACIWLILAVMATLYVMGAFTPNYMKEAPESVKYTVRSGDVLWRIADDYCPDGMDKQDWVWYVSTYNGLHGQYIYPGQEIEVGNIVYLK